MKISDELLESMNDLGKKHNVKLVREGESFYVERNVNHNEYVFLEYSPLGKEFEIQTTSEYLTLQESEKYLKRLKTLITLIKIFNGLIEYEQKGGK